MNTNQYLDDVSRDGAVVTLEQVLAFLRRHLKKLALTALMGAVLAIGLALLLPKQWEASAVIQIGQITNDNPQASPMTLVETVGRAVERLQLPQFEDVVLKKLGLPLAVGEDANTDLIRHSLKATQLKNADLIEVTVRGFSREDAQRYVQAFLDELINAHAVLAKPSMDKVKSNMTEVTRQIAAEEAKKVQLSSLARIRDETKAKASFSESVLLASMAADNDKQLQTLRQREINIREQLNPERTFNTRLFGPIYVSRRHVYPRGSLFALGGLALGLAVAIGWGLLNDFRRGGIGFRS